MPPSDEELLHAFYAGDNAALNKLVRRFDTILTRIARLILVARGVAAGLALGEWDIDERLNEVWTNVYYTRTTNMARWPHQRLTSLHWLIYLLCEAMDRNMGFRAPF